MQSIRCRFLVPLFVVILATGVFLVGVDYAQAVGAASFPQDTNVTFSVGEFVIAAGSDADEVTTTGTNITVTISAGQTFTFKSAGRLTLDTTGDYTSKTCTTTESTVAITPAAGDSQRIVVITPGSSTCADISGTGGGGGGGSTTSTATPTPTPVSTSSPQATPTPTSTTATTPAPVSTGKPTPASRGFVNLANISLKDGDVISAAGSSDPDIYIVNPHGYKRLFLNPAIFGFYGHLGGFSKVKGTTSVVRDVFVTSGLFRNCETNDKKVYGVETTGEDTGTLHWVNTTGEQAVKDDADFFKKVFCINTKEFNWYPKGTNYTSVNQIPDYSRKNTSSSAPVSVVKKYKIVGTSQLNVRASANTSSAILGKLPVGQIIESLEQSGLWHKVKYQTKDGWVHSDYLQAI